MAQATINMMSDRNSVGPKVGRRGFSLTELMISIGILAVGLTMAGALFPAAMQANRRSVQDVLGSIICENGLAVAKARWAELTDEEFNADLDALADFRDPYPKRDPPMAPKPLKVLVDDGENRPAFLTAADRSYPNGDSTSRYGFVLLMRPIDEDADPGTFEGYQLVVTSYRRHLLEGLVVCRSLSARVSEDDANSYDSGGLHVGSPMIEIETGAFATLTQANTLGTIGRLDRPLVFEEGFNPQRFIVVVEQDPNAGNAEVRLSPALATMVTRTGLTGDMDRPGG